MSRNGTLSTQLPAVLPAGAKIIDALYRHPADGARGGRIRLANGRIVFCDPCGTLRNLPASERNV